MLHSGGILLTILFVFTSTIDITHCQGYHGTGLIYDDDEYSPKGRCEPIATPLCQDMKYNLTVFPNILGHTTQDEAALEVHQFYPLVEMKCSKALLLFLCSVYVPVCTNLKEAIPPCKHLCIHARTGCEELMNSFEFKWPVGLTCDDLPEKSKDQLCFSSDDLPNSIPEANIPIRTKACSHKEVFECPKEMEVPNLPQQDGYSFMGAQYCAAPCDKDNILYWESDQREFAHWWIGIWSILCGISTLFTVFTYLIDMSRFRYPERPIVFLSGCYLMVSIAYITGFFTRDTIPCRQFVTDSCQYGSYDNCHKVVVQGTKEAGCTILFMLLYFFSMASSIWWVILTGTWFLAAGLKWGNEAIEAISHYFHLVAWAIPATMTIIILAMARVEGDILSGVCFVGVYDSKPLLWFILIPLVAFLCVGTGFLIAGFVALFHIRTVVKNEGGAKVEKLERLMVRIGVFSVLYTVPATVTIACYFYEHTHRDAWQKGWLDRNCGRLGIHCPCSYREFHDAQPDFTVFIIKYFMMLIVGITSGFWIWSGKTFESWGKFRRRLCCCLKPRNARSNKNGSVTVHMLPGQQPSHTNPNGGRHMYIRGQAM
ncbi:frizzled-2-like [Styela clava]|uniref:frizzled-2-like n=1 Tax=Styela clava TaxID=7725 RepID=UPI001939FA0F|nr:frizzled-2-like [Styela clava]